MSLSLHQALRSLVIFPVGFVVAWVLASDKEQSDYDASEAMFRPYLLLGIVALGIVLGFTIPFHTNKGIGIFVGWISATVLARYVVSVQDLTEMERKFGWLSFVFLALSVVSLCAFLIRWNPIEVEEIDALLFIVCMMFGMVGLSCLWFFALSRLKVTVGDTPSDSEPK